MSINSNQSSTSSLSDLQILILSAMFHDIGKAFRKEFVDLKNKYSAFGEHHNIIGREFIRDAYHGPSKEFIFDLVSFHHARGNTYLSTELHEEKKKLLSLLRLADHIASEARADIDAQDEEPDEKNEKEIVHNSYKKRDKGSKKFYPEKYFNLIIDELLGETSAEELTPIPFSIFLAQTKINVDQASIIIPFYKKSFEENLKLILNNSSLNPDVLIYALKNLFKEYLFFIPSYSQSEKQVESLYTHTIYVAALSSCVYELSKLDGFNDLLNYQSPSANTETLQKVKKNIYLVMIKISGLQKFIFAFGDKDYSGASAGKIIRGRSLLIWLLSEAISKMIIKDLDLSEANILSTISGKCFILLPSNKLESFYSTFSVLKKYLSDIFYPLTLTYSQISLDELENEENFDKLYARAEVNLLDNNDFINNKNSDYSLGVKCKICGNVYDEDHNEVQKLKDKLIKIIKNDQYTKLLKTEYVCYSCLTSIYLGHFADNSSDYVICLDFNSDNVSLIQSSKNSLKFKIGYFKDELKENSSYVYMFSSSSRLFEKWINYSKEINKIRTYLTYMPRIDITDKNFDEISLVTYVENNKEKQLYTYLAFLKSDVDNLGTHIKSLVKNISNLVEVNECLAGLNLSLFNKSITKNIRYENKNEKLFIDVQFNEAIIRNLYYLYAGGDDISIIGRFDKVIDFYYCYLKEIEFLEAFSVSSSVVLFKSGFPIREAVKHAEEGLKFAKDYYDAVNKKKKNAIFLSFVRVPDKTKVLKNRKALNVVSISSNNIKVQDDAITFIEFTDYAKRLAELVKTEKHGISASLTYKLYEIATNDKINDSKKFKELAKMIESIKHSIMYDYYIRKNIDDESIHEDDLKLIKSSFRYPHILALSIMLNSEKVY